MLRATLCAVLVSLILSAAAIAQPASREKVVAALPALQALAELAVARGDVPGLAIAVVRGDEVLYLAGFGEASGIVSAASAPATTVTWYGGDGLVGDDSFTKDSKVAAATEALCLPSPQFGLATADKSKWEPVLASLAKANGGQSDAFGVISYDASNVAINTLAGSGSGKSGQELTDAVVATANSTDGASGSLALDSSGDRKTGPYDYWQVTGAATAAKWAVTGGWEPAGGQLGTVLKAPTCP